VNRFGELRNSNDPLLTFEGDNNVLLQQTSNHLMASFEDYLKTKHTTTASLDTPLGTVEFLKRFDTTLASKFTATQKSELLNQKSTKTEKRK
jgi:acyl-CoA oxidase